MSHTTKGVKVAKDAIDLGIVTTNGPAMLGFYRDVLGFVHEGDIAKQLEHIGIKVIHRLWFGQSLIKLVVPIQDPGAPPAPGGIQGGTGYRYFTMTVHNWMKCSARCKRPVRRSCGRGRRHVPGW